jgi:hemerythrin superfamily protein
MFYALLDLIATEHLQIDELPHEASNHVYVDETIMFQQTVESKFRDRSRPRPWLLSAGT